MRRSKAMSIVALMASCLCGCAAKEAVTASMAQTRMVGLTQSDVRMCAGLPTGTTSDPRGDIWMYEHGGTTPGGLSAPGVPVPMPWGVGVIGISTDGYCRAQVRFVNGRVAEVAYAGATDIGAARNAFCAPIIRSCLSYKESGPNAPAPAPTTPAPPPARAAAQATKK